ncbi:hypothetical protein AB205_0008590 [Aquarana catesbeiana]|uniref:Uncharacterized protein n=2 Tax=Aquarana catesbeiana TaxID=8400 RepID=A0A2G9RKB2_AQUCT|nr:hypothetical protein AB205_0008590 [Aquarana catesbeiana]
MVERQQLGTLPKQTIVRHLQAMFHIPISCLKYLCAKYTFFIIHIGEKRIGTSENTTNPITQEEGEIPTHSEADEEGEVQEVGEIVTTTGDMNVVEEEAHFYSTRGETLIGEIVVCNWDLEKVKENANDVQQKMKNIIDVLGRI